jgi:hypothetical protein
MSLAFATDIAGICHRCRRHLPYKICVWGENHSETSERKISLNRTFMELKQSERIRHQLSAPVLTVPLWKETRFLRLKKGEAHNGFSV